MRQAGSPKSRHDATPDLVRLRTGGMGARSSPPLVHETARLVRLAMYAKPMAKSIDWESARDDMQDDRWLPCGGHRHHRSWVDIHHDLDPVVLQACLNHTHQVGAAFWIR